ncbi:unnamed protein product [Cuscuta epithymum]|uniref:HAT C-terminal dimerisation domain-containing protein n=1 Tax=Cuscuta epithymum TaxID=186058 RepID=A0AAV0FJV7_9ASTE|nr:unnamed protein product [Cuscuta epithymum]
MTLMFSNGERTKKECSQFYRRRRSKCYQCRCQLSTVAVEQEFSQAGNVLTDYRTRLRVQSLDTLPQLVKGQRRTQEVCIAPDRQFMEETTTDAGEDSDRFLANAFEINIHLSFKNFLNSQLYFIFKINGFNAPNPLVKYKIDALALCDLKNASNPPVL